MFSPCYSSRNTYNTTYINSNNIISTLDLSPTINCKTYNNNTTTNYITTTNNNNPKFAYKSKFKFPYDFPNHARNSPNAYS